MWFILILIMVAAASARNVPFSTVPTTTPSSTYIYDSILGYKCDSDSNCNGLVGNSMCLNGICACRPGYTPWGVYRCSFI